MNLQQLHDGLGTLYPPLRTRSGQEIVTEQASGLVDKDGSLAVTVKVLFPPSSLRRTELLVRSSGDGLDVAPLEPPGTADALRFAELARDRWQREQPDDPLGPLCLSKDEHGRCFFHLGPAVAAVSPEPEPPPGLELAPRTDPATPVAKRGKPTSTPPATAQGAS
jgi:hypothetical protein